MITEDNARTARDLCEQKRWHELLEFAEKWRADDQSEAKAFYYLGVGYSALAKFSEAEIAYRRALDLDARDVKAWNNLAGLLYENLQRPVDGVRCMQQALRINPVDKLGWANLATMVGRLGHHEKAMEFANRAIALDSEMVEAYLHKGAAALSLGKMEIVKDVCETLGKISAEKFRRAR